MDEPRNKNESLAEAYRILDSVRDPNIENLLRFARAIALVWNSIANEVFERHDLLALVESAALQAAAAGALSLQQRAFCSDTIDLLLSDDEVSTGKLDTARRRFLECGFASMPFLSRGRPA